MKITTRKNQWDVLKRNSNYNIHLRKVESKENKTYFLIHVIKIILVLSRLLRPLGKVSILGSTFQGYLHSHLKEALVD